MISSQKSWVTVLSLSLFTLSSFGVNSSHSPKFDPKELKLNSEPRPEVIPTLKQNDSQILGTFFAWPQRLLDQRFKEKLPAALNASMSDKDPQYLSPILSELFATQLPEQVDQILASAADILKKREETDNDQQNKSASNHLLEKIIDAGKWLVGEDTGSKTPERTEFLEQFSEDWKKQGEKVATAIKMRDQAIDPQTSQASRDEAKKWLRGPNGVNRDQVMAFVSGQMRNGKTEEAVKWIKAMGWDGYADLQNGGKPERLNFGKTDQQIASALKAYEQRDGKNSGLFAMTLNQTPHTGQFADLREHNGAIVEIQPKTAGPDLSNALASTDPSAVVEALRKPGQQQQQPPRQQPAQPPKQQQVNTAAATPVATTPAAAYEKFCTGCHGKKPRAASLLSIAKDPGGVTRMPRPGKKLDAWNAATAEEKELLRNYLATLPL